VVALVRGVHGLRGAVRVEVLTDRPEERFVPGIVLHREGSDEPLTIASAEAVADGPGWRLRFREISDRTAADALRGAYLDTVVRPDQDLARGEYYWHEVVGVTVRGLDGTDLGVVRDVYRIAETEVFEVAGGPYGSFDLPAVRAFIRIFAPRRGEIVIDADALDLQAPPERPPEGERPRAPRRRRRGGGAAAGETAGETTGEGEAPTGALDTPDGPDTLDGDPTPDDRAPTEPVDATAEAPDRPHASDPSTDA
jgi:16S rRNA processing protein RimM